MVQLTEKLLKEKAKGCSLHHVKKLNFWGHQLDDVSILQTHVPSVEVLSLSVNDISTLRFFTSLPNLRELYLRKNQIKDPNETKYLSASSNLRFLWLLENECANHPNYRSIVIANCPHLVKLDDRDVTQQERDNAQSIIAQSNMSQISSQNQANALPKLPAPPMRQHPKLRSHVIPPMQMNNESPSQNHQGQYQRHPQQQQQQQYVNSNDHYSQQTNELPQHTKENILLAVFALLNELDGDGLTVVRKQIDKIARSGQQPY